MSGEVRVMTAAERAEMERDTLALHAEAAQALKDYRPRFRPRSKQPMPADPSVDLAALAALLQAATPGPWEADTEKTDEGYKTYVMFAPDGSRLFDALNSSATLVQYDYSDDGGSEWDETARRNFALIAAMRNALPDLLRRVRLGDAAREVCDLTADLRSLWKAMGAGIDGAAEAYSQRLKAIDAARARYRALLETPR